MHFVLKSLKVSYKTSLRNLDRDFLRLMLLTKYFIWEIITKRRKRRIIYNSLCIHALYELNTFTAIVDLSRFNNSCLKSPASTLVDLIIHA